MSKPERALFLRAEWKHLAMLNYAVEPRLLAPFVPAGTELDAWQGTTYLSIIGFLFLNTRVRGVPIPFHGCFEEVNLRFYVRRRAGDEWRRGVVFIEELVPRRAIACTARLLYNENYRRVPMGHHVDLDPQGNATSVAYRWTRGGRDHRIELTASGPPLPLEPATEAEFITEHFWGYTRQRNGTTLEYRVAHPSWRVSPARTATLDCDVAAVYGEHFTETLSAAPRSAFLAAGSPVEVYRGTLV